MTDQTQHQSKTKLLNAALHAVRVKGYAGTTLDDICLAAAVTKGSFFHHFKSKDELALAAIAHWGRTTEGLFEGAAYRKLQDPLARLLGYLDLRVALLKGELADYTCFVGTLLQETYATHPDIRAACERGLDFHIAELTRDIEAAKRLYAPKAAWSAPSVGYFIQTVLQGSFIFAKAKQGQEVVRQNLEHLRRYLMVLFGQSETAKRKRK